MATIVTRETTQTDGTSPKGSPLTNAEVDTNFINLNDDKVEVSGAIIFEAQAGEALSKGDVVYVSGVSGNKPVVSKADADDASKMPAYGLTEADASLNAAVNVVTFGTIYELDTSGYSVGDTVYVSTTPGSLTATKPAGESSLIQNVGKVIRSHASAGSIKVGGAGRTNDTPNLNNGNVFIGNSSNQAEARALTTADVASGTFADARIAESNVTQHEAALSITESQISDLQTYLTSSTVRAAVEAATDSNVFTDADHSKLDGIEASADVTDTANVTAAGALMDSEITNLAQVKAFDSSDYATAAQGTTADSALQNVVEDTTPQLGGTLDANSNNIDMGTNVITDTKVGQWDTAYGWGDHGAEGYLTAESDTLSTVTGRGNTTNVNLVTSANVKAGSGASDEGFFTGQKIYRSATGGSGLNFTNISTIRPTNNAGSNTNGTISLGESSYRFDDGYFNGTVTAGTLSVSAVSGDSVTLVDTNLTASASNIGNVRVAWDDSAGTRVAYVGSVNSDEFWVNNQYSTVVLTYAGSRMFETVSGGAKLYGKLNITDSEYDNHLELNRSNEQWRFSPSTNGSLDIRRVSGTGTAVLDILSDTNITGDVAAGASATGGVAAYAINYSGDHLLNVFGALRSSGNTILTYGAKPSPTVNGGYVSAAGNFAFEKTALELSGGGLSVKFSPSGTDAVDSALTMSTMLDVSGSTAVGCHCKH